MVKERERKKKEFNKESYRRKNDLKELVRERKRKRKSKEKVRK